MTKLQELTGELIAAASQLEEAPAQEASAELVRHLQDNPGDVERMSVDIVFDTLRGNRHFETIKSLAETMIGNGRDEFKIRHCLAQSLIDTGTPTIALDVLKPLVRRSRKNPKQNAEAVGLGAVGYGFW